MSSCQYSNSCSSGREYCFKISKLIIKLMISLTDVLWVSFDRLGGRLWQHLLLSPNQPLSHALCVIMVRLILVLRIGLSLHSHCSLYYWFHPPSKFSSADSMIAEAGYLIKLVYSAECNISYVETRFINNTQWRLYDFIIIIIIIIITSNLFTRSKRQPYKRIRGAV